MKKLYKICILVLVLIVLFSCESEKEIKNYTTLEQLDFINDNLVFLNEDIKLAKSYPNIINLDDFDKNGNNNLVEKDNKHDVNYKIIDDEFHSLSPLHSTNIVTTIKCKYMNYYYAVDDYIITDLASITDNFSLFGERLGGNPQVIIDTLLDRDFMDGGGATIRHFYYGLIEIQVSIYNDVITGIGLFVSNYGEGNTVEPLISNYVERIPIDRIENTCLKDLDLTIENFDKYLMPFEDFYPYCIEKKIRINMKDDTISLDDVGYQIIYENNYNYEYIKQTMVDPDSIEFLYFETRVINLYFTTWYYDLKMNQPIGKEILDKDDQYIKEIRRIKCLLELVPNSGVRIDNFNDILEKYQYLREYIINDPYYDEYIESYGVIG